MNRSNEFQGLSNGHTPIAISRDDSTKSRHFVPFLWSVGSSGRQLISVLLGVTRLRINENIASCWSSTLLWHYGDSSKFPHTIILLDDMGAKRILMATKMTMIFI